MCAKATSDFGATDLARCLDRRTTARCRCRADAANAAAVMNGQPPPPSPTTTTATTTTTTSSIARAAAIAAVATAAARARALQVDPQALREITTAMTEMRAAARFTMTAATARIGGHQLLLTTTTTTTTTTMTTMLTTMRRPGRTPAQIGAVCHRRPTRPCRSRRQDLEADGAAGLACGQPSCRTVAVAAEPIGRDQA